MTALRVAAVSVLAAIAALAALLAADVHAWPVAIGDGDAAYAIAPAQAKWTPATNLGGLAESLLGTSGDLAARLALQRFDAAAGHEHQANSALPVGTQLTAAINSLSGPASSPDPQVASQARTLLGILTFAEAAAGGGASPTETAIADFADAVRVAPGDTAAKFDLELLLRRLAANGARKNNKIAKGFGRTGHSGASGGVPGSGF